MRGIIISTEATSDLSKELQEKYEISVADMNFRVDDKEYSLKDSTLTNKEFYDLMRKGCSTATSQINTFEAKEYLENLLKTGKDVLHISFSSALSGTYNNFVQVAEELNSTHENKVYVVNSLCASFGQGMLCIWASEKSKTGISIEELVKQTEDFKLHVNHLFIIDNLKYLARTGRISKTTAVLGTVLQIKPVLHVDNEGRLTNYQKVLSRKKSINVIVDKFKENYNHEYDKVFITQADCIDEANLLADKVQEVCGTRPTILDLGAVIGSHSGPGTLALFFSVDKR